MPTSVLSNHDSIPKLIILDVGHGNSAVFISEEDVIIMDAGPGTHLVSYLEHEGIHHIEYLLLSHAHKDHIAGIISLLDQKSVTISNVMLNPDKTDTDLWDDLIYQVSNRGDIVLTSSLTTNDSVKFQYGDIDIHIAAPIPYLALKGVGGRERRRRTITSNTLSVVFQVRIKGATYVTFFSDIDELGFEYFESDCNHPISPVVVYPHHGGGGRIHNPSTFAKHLCKLIKPQLAIFSMGRRPYPNPRPEIVREIVSAVPDCWIACTQLSKHCSDEVDEQAEMITPTLARGFLKNECCAGSIEIPLDGDLSSIKPDRCTHQKFIEAHVKDPMCRT